MTFSMRSDVLISFHDERSQFGTVTTPTARADLERRCSVYHTDRADTRRATQRSDADPAIARCDWIASRHVPRHDEVPALESTQSQIAATTALTETGLLAGSL